MDHIESSLPNGRKRIEAVPALGDVRLQQHRSRSIKITAEFDAIIRWNRALLPSRARAAGFCRSVFFQMSFSSSNMMATTKLICYVCRKRRFSYLAHPTVAVANS